ncbi:glycine cleavage system aminomethyltransferase GcvT [Eubacteriales bacterium OttesenSCG-928-K08]|nr:glycine cleavage system aminomethyltransferase GcvT [Eubacteriales bacterium OttesenSCG-928-K08]
MENCKRTPLYQTHIKLGGKMVDFGGWALPVQYSSILDEHRAVRENAGLFDVSHMGEILVSGKDAFAFLQLVLTNDLTGLMDNRCRYSFICYENGGTVDDVIVYRKNEESYLIVVNASNTDKDFEWLKSHADGFDAKIENQSADFAQLALQGPRAQEILAPLCEGELPEKSYSFVEELAVAGISCLVSRTGYTGEDGFELYCAANDGAALHAAILEAGKAFGLLPCGLGARDTLRFEAAMPLYGHELTADITPREAGLGFAIKVDNKDFIGRQALIDPPKRKRIGLKIVGRGIAREGYAVLFDGKPVGVVTSGSPSPTLGGNYAMALVDACVANEERFAIDVRGRALEAERVKTPFYKRI